MRRTSLGFEFAISIQNKDKGLIINNEHIVKSRTTLCEHKLLQFKYHQLKFILFIRFLKN